MPTAPRDITRLPALADEFVAFIKQYDGMLVGRDNEFELIKFAVLLGQHVLFFGPPGTGKTLACDLVFGGITGAEKFAVECSKFMTDEAFFGPFDYKAYTQESAQRHNVEGMLPEAHYARFGEMLDMNEASLRSLLGALNERRLVRGKQVMDIPLHTAYCDTNIDPATFLRQFPNAEAALDRLAFMRRVHYLDNEGDLAEMVSRFQGGKLRRPDNTIDHAVIKELSGYITNPPGLINDRRVTNSFAEAFHEYRAARAEMSDEDRQEFILPRISDRRFNIASMMLEASAVLDGRVEAKVEDIMPAGLVLCTSQPERDLWDEIAHKAIKTFHERHQTNVSDAQLQQLGTITDQLKRDVEDEVDPEKARDSLIVLFQQYQAILPVSDEAQAVHTKLEKRFKALKKKVLDRLPVQQTGLEAIG